MATDAPKGSLDAMMEANRQRGTQSRHGGLGMAGYISQADAGQAGHFLTKPGEISIVNIPDSGILPNFEIGVAWDNVAVPEKTPGLLGRLAGKKTPPPSIVGVDIDLGCLYILKNASRGGLQAFGEAHGALESEPYIFLSGDERTGDREGPDETILVNGAQWGHIERILIYVYIYHGARDWSAVRPQIQVRVPGEQPMLVTLGTPKAEMSVCAIAGLENVRGGIKMTSYLEYFPGHAEMDRAFGFGLQWEAGRKDEGRL